MAVERGFRPQETRQQMSNKLKTGLWLAAVFVGLVTTIVAAILANYGVSFTFVAGSAISIFGLVKQLWSSNRQGVRR